MQKWFIGSIYVLSYVILFYGVIGFAFGMFDIIGSFMLYVYSILLIVYIDYKSN